MNTLSEQRIDCPYCGEAIDILVDCSESYQSYIEDCQVCCRPINMQVSVDDENKIAMSIFHEDE